MKGKNLQKVSGRERSVGWKNSNRFNEVMAEVDERCEEHRKPEDKT